MSTASQMSSPSLDGLISRCILSPLSDDYQSVLAAPTAREQTRLLLDILPTLGPDAFNAFVDSVSRYRPHLRGLLEQYVPKKAAATGRKISQLSEGQFPPACPDIEVIRRIQKKQRKSYIQLSQRRAAVVDFRFGTSKVDLEDVCATISSLNLDEVQAEIQQKTKTNGGDLVSEDEERVVVEDVRVSVSERNGG